MARTFHDLNIQSSISSGHSSIQQIVQRAEKLDIDRIAVCDYLTDHNDLKNVRSKIEQTESQVEILTGVKIRAENSRDLKDRLSSFRDHVDVVVIHGGDAEINRLACEDSRVDILAHPEFKRKDSGIDHVIAKKASQNRVAIELSFRSILKTYGKLRSQIMSHMKRNIRLADKYNTPLILNSGAQHINEMRRPRDMLGFAYCMGISLSDAFDLVESNPASIIDRTRNVNSQTQLRPGLHVENKGEES